ncbi:MAG TPA: hypothetical protein VE615_03860 [Gaiellaceae bacterium]|nr:hypothetical protein [Gaiellaceae bacterium]
MAQTLDTVFEHVRALLAAPQNGGAAPARDRLELTLTEGYAAALALDGDRMRLERRIEQLTFSFAEGDESRPEELRRLIARLHAVEDDLADLRALLEKLRRRAAKAA